MWPLRAVDQVAERGVDRVDGAEPVHARHRARRSSTSWAQERAVVRRCRRWRPPGRARRLCSMNRVDGGAHLLAVADVGGQRHGARAELAGQRLQLALGARQQADGGAAGGQRARPIARPIPREAPVTSARVVASMRMRAEDMLQAMSQDQVTVAEEEYLQTIFWLQEAGLPMTGANVARAMQLSAPTVHEMIGRLERDGYVTRGADKVARVHRQRPRARRGHRPPPPADRALPHRRAGDPVGRRARGGRAARARDVAASSRSACCAAIGDAKTCPHGHPITPGDRDRGRAAGRRRGRAPR